MIEIMTPIHDTTLQLAHTNFDELALKNFVLFATKDDQIFTIIEQKHCNIAFDYLAKYPNDFQIIMLDEPSFTRLYTKALETKADKQMSNITQTTQDVAQDQDEDDISDLSSFLKTSADIMTSTESAPIIKFVNSLFYQAIKKKASDIHIEVHEQKGEIRYRVDGILLKHIELDKKIISLVISRIKVISNLDISEKRIPQDGRTAIKISGKTLDVRVSILPTFYGERVVMRLLMQSEDIPTLQNLGLSNDIISTLQKLTSNSYGMILVTGPTGSGKSTTLHSLLQSIYTKEKNIITVEDPVEYKSDKINQIQVNEKVGLTFASGLRSILRQDPDIIMVGEIRDSQTASISIQAALTGHLVFSTLHTNRAYSAINRLIDMGVERFLISSSILGVLAQRLVRKLCDKCKQEDTLTQYHIEHLHIDPNAKIFKPTGCASCNYTGYNSRVAIAELLVITKKVKQLLQSNFDDEDLLQIALEENMIPLNQQIINMVQDGVTSIEELLRLGII